MDRRSRERFIESNNQISALVEKFKVEGGPYRKYAGPNINIDNMEHHQKIPLTAYGRPGFLSVLMFLIQRSWTQLNLFRWEGFTSLCHWTPILTSGKMALCGPCSIINRSFKCHGQVLG